MRIPPMLIATALLSGCVSIDRLPERERAALFCARDTLKAHGASEVEFVTGLGDLPLVIRYAHAGREGRRHTSALEITKWAPPGERSSFYYRIGDDEPLPEVDSLAAQCGFGVVVVTD